MSAVSSGLWVGVLAVVPLFVALGTAVIWLHSERKRSRVPIQFKLLRGPGETLRRRIAEMDESFPQNAFIASILAFVLSVGGLQLAVLVFPGNPLVALSFAAALFFVCTAGLCWLVIRHIRTRRNYLLGYLGERAVGEHLNTLEQAGFRVFHDVPAENRGRKFNVDHVVVGPTGLFSIETKTRRKGRARPGREDHKVVFDGRQLVWPWGEDRKGLDQAVNEAEWLSKWLREITGIEVQAEPILALPGWYVECGIKSAFKILNEKNVPRHIRDWAKGRELTPEQIDLIARQLEARCRDVED
jgi:hypothetical protein